MDCLFDRIKKILERFIVAERLFLFLDFDGTLTPIVSRPEEAHLSEEMKSLLRDLERNGRVLLAIVSGRSLKDIRGRVGLRGIYYVGNHGLEIFEPKHGMESLVHKKMIEALGEIRDGLNHQFQDREGVFVEDKGYAVAVHYRNVDLF